MRKKLPVGIDAINFQLGVPNNHEGLYLKPVSLKNEWGVTYATLSVNKGLIEIYFNPSLQKRKDNTSPYILAEMDDIEFVKSDLEYDLQRHLDENEFGEISKSKLKRIESNVTLTVKNCEVHQVLNFINRSFCDTTNKVFQCPGKDFKYFKEDESVYVPTITKQHEYVFKCYDKTHEEIKKGNINVEKNLLRFEIVLLDRLIKRIFGKAITFDDILTKKSLKKVINEFQRIFVDVFIGKYVEPCKENIIEKLFEDLTEYKSPQHTIMKYKEVILDQEFLRLALQRWYVKINSADYSSSRIYDYRDLRLPKNVYKTILQIRKLLS